MHFYRFDAAHASEAPEGRGCENAGYLIISPLFNVNLPQCAVGLCHGTVVAHNPGVEFKPCTCHNTIGEEGTGKLPQNLLP